MRRFSVCWLLLLCGISARVRASPFQPGDLFITGPDGNIYRYDESGTLLQTIPTAGSPVGLAFDPAGNLYVALGATVEKFNNSGSPAGTFVSGFPGTLGAANDVTFDAAGNAYVAGIADLNNDFLNKYSGAGVPLGYALFPEGQENQVYANYTGGKVFVTPGTTDIVDVFDSGTLAPLASVSTASGGGRGDVRGLPGGGFLLAGPSGIRQFDAAGNLVLTYDAPVLHGEWIGVDALSATTFWAVSDFDEAYEFRLGISAPIFGFQDASHDARAIAVFAAVPEPSLSLAAAAGLAALFFARRRGWLTGR